MSSHNRLFAERFWERDFLTLDAYGFQGLREEDDQDLIPIALPQVRARLMSEPWRWGSRFSIDTDALALTRIDGLDTRRVSATPAWQLPWYSPIGDRYELRLDVRGDLLSDRRRSADLRGERHERHRTGGAARDAALELALDRRGVRRLSGARAGGHGDRGERRPEQRRHPQRRQPGLRVRRHEPAGPQPLSRARSGARWIQHRLWPPLRHLHGPPFDQRHVRPGLFVRPGCGSSIPPRDWKTTCPTMLVGSISPRPTGSICAIDFASTKTI